MKNKSLVQRVGARLIAICDALISSTDANLESLADQPDARRTSLALAAMLTGIQIGLAAGLSDRQAAEKVLDSMWTGANLDDASRTYLAQLAFALLDVTQTMPRSLTVGDQTFQQDPLAPSQWVM